MQTFLQTKEWAEFQKSIGRKVWSFNDGKISANIIEHDLPFRKNYLYIPYGPEVNFENMEGGIKNASSQFVAYLKKLAKENKSIFVKIEPTLNSVIEVLFNFGFKKSKKEVNPHKTVVLDIDKSDLDLMDKMHHKTRYNIRVAERNGITVGVSDDMDRFWKLLSKTSKRQKFSTHKKDYYFKLYDLFKNGNELKTELFFASYENKIIAGALLLYYGDICYYLHGGSDYDYHQLMAPHVLHWQIIRQARDRGFKYYDFGGSEGSKWPGITRFKLSWGGRQVEYPGSFDLPISRFWFLMYRIARRIF